MRSLGNPAFVGWSRRLVVSLSGVALTCAAPAQRTAPGADACAAVRELLLPEVKITSASVVPARNDLPETCDVLGTTRATIGFQVRMPTQGWNGKLYFGGNGGFGGRLRKDVSQGLSRKYATVSTDTGHRIFDPVLDISDASWALDSPDAELDFAHRAVHETAVLGKAVIRAYYGVAPRRSYFEGCSGGGRQALQEATRYPEDFDGIIARDPALDFTGAFIAYAWNVQAQRAAEVSVETLRLWGDAVLARCDGLDGLDDGLIDDPRRCQIQPRSLLCRRGAQTACLSSIEVAALEKIYDGPRDSRGRQLHPGLSLGGERPEADDRGWADWVLSSPASPSRGQKLAQQFFRFLAFVPDRPRFVVEDFDFDADPPRMEAAARNLNAISVELQAFKERGDKLLLYQGWSDPAVAPLRTVQYFESLRARFGTSTGEFARLFMVPGAHHCGGGPGPNEFEALSALERWVEEGVGPSSIVAVHRRGPHGPIDRTRPLCPYPSVARHSAGSTDDAASFDCVDPPER
jgi:feruloyl esterase